MSNIIPKPLVEQRTEGTFYIGHDTEIVMDATCSQDELFAAELLRQAIYEHTNYEFEIRKAFAAPVSKAIFIEKRDIDIDVDIKEQAYILSVTKDLITVSGPTSEAVMYGIQTLIQFFMLEGGAIACRVIKDAPILKRRGFFHDASRGRVRKLEEYKKLADTMALFKLNQLQLYIEHSFCFKEFSEVWRDDTPLTANDILELDAYCHKLHIDLVPSIASFGHLYKVLRTKSFESLCELDGMSADPFSFDQRMQHHTINVVDERSFDFVKNMLDEFIPLFSSEYVNICADETFDLGKGKSKAKADEIGVNQLYVDFVNKLADYCVNIGKTPMFWGDIIVGCPEYADKLNKNLVCLNWGYADNELERNTQVLAEKGMRQLICPGCHGWRHMINKLEMAYRNISLMCGYAIKYNAEGLLNTDWGDYGHLQDPLFSIPGLIYGGAFAWSGVRDEKEIDEQISKLYYGDSNQNLIELVKKVALGEIVRWEELVQYKEHSSQYADLYSASEIYERIDTDNLKEANVEIINNVNLLLNKISSVNLEGKKLIRKIELFANGQILMHEIMEAIGRKYYNKGASISKEECFELASKIEHWMYAYKKNWRQDSRESELYRIEEVFYWYSDALRSFN